MIEQVLILIHHRVDQVFMVFHLLTVYSQWVGLNAALYMR